MCVVSALGVVSPANYNTLQSDCNWWEKLKQWIAVELLQEAGVKRLIPLNVSDLSTRPIGTC